MARALALATALLFGLAALTGSARAAAPKHPNLVIFLADDLGWADVGYHGSPIETPALDRLAREGVQLDRFYVQPICSPTRTMLMTGRDPMEQGLIYDQINPWNPVGIPFGEKLLPEYFRAAGYQTGIIGKWHLGHTQAWQLPNARGFEYFYGHLHTHVDFYEHQRRGGHDWQRNGKSLDERGQYLTDLAGADVSRFIRERDKARPFLLYVPWAAPHSPMQAPQALVDHYAKLPEAGFRRVYAAMVDAMDKQVGSVLSTLDEQGLANDTIVLFASDNGGFNGFGGRNEPLRGQKGQTFEGGIRVVGVMRWPGHLKAGSVSQQVMTAADVLPTLAAAAGVPVESPKPLLGRNLWPELAAGRAAPRSEDLFFASEIPVPGTIHLAVRSGEWKLVEVVREGNRETKVTQLLFRIDEDPNEQHDLAAANPERVRELSNRINTWRSRHPLGGLRVTLVPHPGWLPPKDWAEAVVPAERLQRTTQPEYELSPELLKAIGERGVAE